MNSPDCTRCVRRLPGCAVEGSRVNAKGHTVCDSCAAWDVAAAKASAFMAAQFDEEEAS